MALSDGELATKVEKRLTQLGEQAAGVLRPNIILHIPEARAMVARAIANDYQHPQRKELQKLFTGAITSQAFDLTASLHLDLKTAEPMILTAPFPAVRVGTTAAWYKADRQLMDLMTVRNDQIFYSVENYSLVFKAKSTVTGTANIIAQSVPLTVNWPTGDAADLLINAIVQLVAPGVRV